MITLITIVLLTIMAVAFLTSSSLDQATAHAFANNSNAELAAKTAVNTAIARLTDNLSTYSDSATSWEKVNSGGGLRFEGTTLYYRDKSPDDAAAGGALAPLHALPLISGAVAVPIPAPPQSTTAREATLAGAFPANLDDTNSFDLNHARSATDTQGEIGAPKGAAARPEFRGRWVDQTDAPDGKVTARYAYWMEDESFKANVNLMGVTPRGSGTRGDSPSQIPLQGLFKALGVSGFDAMANAIFNSRANFPGSKFFEYPAIDQASPTTIADSAKFESTIFSAALNLSRTGTKRINLNKVVSDSTDPTAIRSQLDQIIKAVSYQAPNFAQRFYRTGSDKNSLDVPGTGNPSDRTIYLNKIAANIRDYIDTDSQPTIVNNDTGLTINIGAAPTRSLPKGGTSGPNVAVAIGKEAVPILQEYLLRVKLLTFSPRIGPSATYKIEIDHYIEFWNMSTKDIPLSSLGPNPFLRVANQFGWDDGGAGIPAGPGRDFSVPLSVFQNSTNQPLVFAAGKATVLTTDQTPLPPTFAGVDATRVFRPPAGTPPDAVRVLQGTTIKKSGSQLRLNSIPRPTNSSSASDYETELILGNDNGILEGFGSPAVYYITLNVDDASPDPTGASSKHFDTTQYYFRASSLKGNSPAYTPTVSQTGDPRTNNEQLELDSSASVADDQTGYKTELHANSPPSATNNDASPTVLNTTYVDPTLWIDPGANIADASHAPEILANAPMTSVGQLGDIFDPARPLGASGNIRYSRGGGRSFKLGQPDDLWDQNSNSASREWASWRLADIFSVSDLARLDGQININGVSRDGGTALKAALYGYSFLAAPDTDPDLASKALDDTSIDALIDQLKARLTNDSSTYSRFSNSSGPMAERGELSEMPIFDSIVTGSKMYYLAPGVDTTKAYDRGREELFRRIAGLITTRGNIFTVYAVGQSLIPLPSGSTNPPVVTATSQTKVTFRIDPVWTGGVPSDPFDPTSSARFKKPDNYAIKILYVGD